MPENEDGVRASVRAPKTIMDKIDEIAARENRSRSYILIEATKEYLARHYDPQTEESEKDRILRLETEVQALKEKIKS